MSRMWGNVMHIGPLLKATVEDLAGIKSVGKTFNAVTIEPQWGEIGVSPNGHTYTARAEFPASGAYVSYSLTWNADGSVVTGTVDGTHDSGTLIIPGLATIPLVGGAQAVTTDSLAVDGAFTALISQPELLALDGAFTALVSTPEMLALDGAFTAMVASETRHARRRMTSTITARRMTATIHRRSL